MRCAHQDLKPKRLIKSLIEQTFSYSYTLYTVLQALYSATFRPKHPHFCRRSLYCLYALSAVLHHLQPICNHGKATRSSGATGAQPRPPYCRWCREQQHEFCYASQLWTDFAAGRAASRACTRAPQGRMRGFGNGARGWGCSCLRQLGSVERPFRVMHRPAYDLATTKPMRTRIILQRTIAADRHSVC